MLKRYSHFFLRLLLPYLLIFLVPMASLGALVIYINVKQAYISEEKRNFAELEACAQMLSIRFEELEAISNSMARNDIYRKNVVLSHVYNAMHAMHEMRTYLETNRMIDMLLVQYSDSNDLYTNAGYYQLDVYAKNFLSSENSRTRFAEALDSDEPCFVIDGSSGKLHYIVPMVEYGKTQGHTIFQIDRSVLNEVFSLMRSDSVSLACVTDAENNLLLRMDYNPSAAAIDEEILSALPQSIQWHEGPQYICYSFASATLDWTFHTLVDRAWFVFGANPWNRQATGFLLVLCVCCLIMALFIALRQFRSLHRILQNIENEQVKNIDDMVEAVIFESSAIQNQLVLQQPLVYAQLTLSLLDGILSPSETIRSISEYQHFDQYAAYAALSLVSDKAFDGDCLAEITSALTGFQFDNGIGYACALPKRNGFAVLLYFNSAENADVLNAASRLCDIVLSCAEVSLTVGAGNTYTSIEQVSQSYEEAVTASEYSIVYPEERVIEYSKVRNSGANPIWYSLDDLVELSLCLRRGDCLAARNVINVLFSAAKSETLTPIMVHSMISEILSHIIRTVCDLKLYKPEYAELFSYSSLQEIEVRLIALADEICDGVHQNTNDRDAALCEEITRKIQENLGQYELSMSSVAQELNISVSHLGRTLKKETGQTFVEYVTELRIQEAKRILAQTDMPVAEITSKVGYSDTSSFIRVFKRIEGVTPGAYRKSVT